MPDFVVSAVAMLFAARLLYAAAVTPHAAECWNWPFGPEVPPRDISFDIASGILLPFFCIIADPILFRAALFGSPLLGHYALLAYLTIGTAMLALAIWLMCRRPAALLCGSLTVAALLAFLFGVVLLSLSLMGAFMAGIGLLGLSPFVSAVVFWRNARQAWAQARESVAAGTWMAAVMASFGFAVACAGPLLTFVYVDTQITQATEMAMSADPTGVAQGVKKLQRWHLVLDDDRLVWVYAAEKEAARRERLAEAYRKLTGADIGHRLAALRD